MGLHLLVAVVAAHKVLLQQLGVLVAAERVIPGLEPLAQAVKELLVVQVLTAGLFNLAVAAVGQLPQVQQVVLLVALAGLAQLVL
jgi:hypothetical protein